MKDCVSLDIAKKLKEAGWKQDDREPCHYGIQVVCENGVDCPNPRLGYDKNDPTFKDFKHETMCLGCKDYDDVFLYTGGDLTTNWRMVVAAPTIAELLDAIPRLDPMEKSGKSVRNQSGYLHGCLLSKSYELDGSVVYIASSPEMDNVEASNPADALALLWLALKEKKIL